MKAPRIVLSLPALLLAACLEVPSPVPTAGEHCEVVATATCEKMYACNGLDQASPAFDTCIERLTDICCDDGAIPGKSAESTCDQPTTWAELDVTACVEDYEARVCGEPVAETSTCWTLSRDIVWPKI